MLRAEVDVEGHKLPYHAALGQAVPQIFDCIDGRQEVCSRCMQRNADRSVPPEDETKTLRHVVVAIRFRDLLPLQERD
jgi:hypothetical protein